VICLLIIFLGFGCTSKPALAEETEILKITVGEPTKFGDLVNQNTANLAVPRKDRGRGGSMILKLA
jgi:hypothetical protein